MPDVGGSNVVSILMSVVFPAPFGPSRPNTSPASTARDNASTALSFPKQRVSASVVRMDTVSITSQLKFRPPAAARQAEEPLPPGVACKGNEFEV